MKRLAVALVVLLALLLVGDRVGASLAGSAVASEVRSSTRLTAEPEVEVTGFPFITQALAGRYEQVEVSATDVPAGDLTVRRLQATLTGVRVPLSDVVSGSVGRVPVERVRARALVSYDELERRAGDRRVSLEPAGDRVRVTGSVEVLGQTLSATAVSRVEVVEGDLLVTAESYEVADRAVDDLLSRALGGRLDLRIPVTGLPYGLTVTGVDVGPEGVWVVAGATGTVLAPG